MRTLNTPRSLDIYQMSTRECRYFDELQNLNHYLFPQYDKKLCEYSCSLRLTEREFGCVPWDIVYPHKDKTTRVCQGKSALGFKKLLEKNTLSNETCQECKHPRCHSFSYFSMVRLMQCNFMQA